MLAASPKLGYLVFQCTRWSWETEGKQKGTKGTGNQIIHKAVALGSVPFVLCLGSTEGFTPGEVHSPGDQPGVGRTRGLFH